VLRGQDSVSGADFLRHGDCQLCGPGKGSGSRPVWPPGHRVVVQASALEAVPISNQVPGEAVQRAGFRQIVREFLTAIGVDARIRGVA
jgi:hypothetical protein